MQRVVHERLRTRFLDIAAIKDRFNRTGAMLDAALLEPAHRNVGNPLASRPLNSGSIGREKNVRLSPRGLARTAAAERFVLSYPKKRGNRQPPERNPGGFREESGRGDWIRTRR